MVNVHYTLRLLVRPLRNPLQLQKYCIHTYSTLHGEVRSPRHFNLSGGTCHTLYPAGLYDSPLNDKSILNFFKIGQLRADDAWAVIVMGHFDFNPNPLCSCVFSCASNKILDDSFDSDGTSEREAHAQRLPPCPRADVLEITDNPINPHQQMPVICGFPTDILCCHTAQHSLK